MLEGSSRSSSLTKQPWVSGVSFSTVGLLPPHLPAKGMTATTTAPRRSPRLNPDLPQPDFASHTEQHSPSSLFTVPWLHRSEQGLARRLLSYQLGVWLALILLGVLFHRGMLRDLYMHSLKLNVDSLPSWAKCIRAL